MNENDLRDHLPAERSLPPSRRRDMQERLMAQIQQEDKVTRNHFRLVMAVVAAVLIAVIGAAAVVAGTNEEDSKPPVMSPASVDRSFPDADEVSRAMQGSGIDQGLAAERLDCFVLDPPLNWSGGDAEGWLSIRLDDGVGTEPSIGSDPVTPDLMASRCLQVWDNYLAVPAANFDYEVCVRDAVRPQMVVTLDGASCEHANINNPQTGEVRAITDADVDELNHMRAVEYALLAPMEDCPTAEQVETWVHQVLDEERLDLEVTIDNEGIVEPPLDEPQPAQPCPRFAHVDWEAGVVSIEPFRS